MVPGQVALRLGLGAGSGALLAGLLAAAPAGAALEKYELRLTRLTFSSVTSPHTELLPNANARGEVAVGGALLESPGPRLRRLHSPTDQTATIVVPQLSGFIFASRHFSEGPAPDQSGVSGSSGSRIVWGTLTGWTVSGRNWCNSEPATVCVLAGDVDEATTASQRASPFYDLGTWIFHGSGFTARGFVYTRFTTGVPGENQQYLLRGALSPDGTVPALPLAGIAALGGGVLAAGLVALGWRRG